MHDVATKELQYVQGSMDVPKGSYTPSPGYTPDDGFMAGDSDMSPEARSLIHRRQPDQAS